MKKAVLAAVIVATLIVITSTRTTAQRRRQSTRGKPTSSLSLEQQAEQQAHAFWNARITQCGADYYTRDRLYIHQFRNPRIDVQHRSVTPADRLNGIQYLGMTNFYAAQSRTYSPSTTLYNDPGWGQWSDGFTASMGGVGLYAEVRKEHGRWTVTPSDISQARSLEAVTCAEVANPLESYRNWVRKRQQAAMTAEIRQFLSQAESYWHMYFNDLPSDMYPFLAKHPNSLSRFVFFPSGWAIIGNYESTWNNVPDDIKAASQAHELSSTAMAPNGGWVMLNNVTENFNGRERRGWASNKLSPSLLTKMWEFYNDGRRIDIVRIATNGSWAIVVDNRPNTGTPCYLTEGEHGFSYWFSDDMPRAFASAIRKLYEDRDVCRINDIAFMPNGAYVIVYNYREYVANNVPPKILEGLEYWKNAPFSTGSTNVSIGFNGEWVLYNGR